MNLFNNYNPFVFNAIPQNSHCLDVGCNTGNLGKSLIINKNCTVDGLDCNKAALESAKKAGYRNLYNLDLNKRTDILTLNNKYDCIICADVLEHLSKPDQTLKILKESLTKNGILVASVPNIGFIQQRVYLLFGKFDYNPKGGLMDITHLRFFTKKSLTILFKKAGFKKPTLSGYALVKDRYFFLRFLTSLWPELFALQFLVIAKK